jgi:hypothetical protein
MATFSRLFWLLLLLLLMLLFILCCLKGEADGSHATAARATVEEGGVYQFIAIRKSFV